MSDVDREEYDSAEDIPDEARENLDGHEKAIRWDMLPPEEHPFVVSMSVHHKEDGMAMGVKLTPEQLKMIERGAQDYLEALADEGIDVSVTEHVVDHEDEPTETPGYQ